MNEMNTFVDHLSKELTQLYELFDKRWPEYKDSWKERPFWWLAERFYGEVTELQDAIGNGEGWERIRDEALDCILTGFFLVERANAKMEGGVSA
jgi:NTP pyrophosphatase (non-canonical NTP hydrolase)